MVDQSWQQKKGTLWVNEHPINKLFVDKAMQLAGLSGDNDYADAYREVKKLAKGDVDA